MSWLDDIVGILVLVGADFKARRRTWNVISGPTFADDVANARLDVDYTSVRVQERSLQVTVADLTSGTTSQTFNLGAPLPANAQILGAELQLAAPFGTVAATCVADIGSSGDPDAIVTAADILAAAVDGQASTRPPGIAPNKRFASATQLQLTITADAALNLLGIGDMTARVLFAEMP